MVRWLVAKGARVTPHELELAAFGGYEQPGAQPARVRQLSAESHAQKSGRLSKGFGAAAAVVRR